jgi:hypothetical protein
MSKVSVCKKDVCLNVVGPIATFVGISLGVALLSFGISKLIK